MSIVLPPLTEQGESYDDIANFNIGSGHSSGVNSVAFSSDGKYIISGSSDKSVKLWSVEERKLVYSFEGHSDSITSVAFSNDGKFIVSGSGSIKLNDNSVKLWSVDEKKVAYSFEGHNDWIYSVAFSNNGKFIVSAANDDSIKLWSVDERRILDRFESQSKNIDSVSFSNNGKYIVLIFNDESIRLWSIKNRRFAYSLEENNSWINSVVFNRKYIISGFNYKSWKVLSDKEKKVKYGSISHITSIAFSSDERVIVLGSKDKSLKLWSRNEKRLIYSFDGYNNSISSVAFSSDGKFIVSGSVDRSIKLWSIVEKRFLCSFHEHSGNVNSVAFSNNGKLIASGSSDKSVKLWSIAEQRLLYSIEYHSSSINSVAFSKDGKYIISGAEDESVNCWSMEQRKLVYSFEGHIDDITSIAFSSEGKYILTGSKDESVKIWSMDKKKPLHTYEGHSDAVNSVAFSNNGNFLISGSRDESVKLWSVEEKRLIYSFEGHSGAVNSVAFSNNGKFFISGSNDKSVKLWSVEEKRLIYSFEGHSGAVNSVAFSNNGKFFISGSSDKSVKIWSVEEKRLVEDIYSIGDNWVWFDDVNKRLLRVDDGSLLLDRNYDFVAPAPISKEIEIRYPSQIILSHQHNSTAKLEIINRDEKHQASIIKCHSSNPLSILYPNILYQLSPESSQELELEFGLTGGANLSKPYSDTITLHTTVAHRPLESKKIAVNIRSPLIELVELSAVDEVVTITLINNGNEDITELSLKLYDEIQTITSIKQGESVKKAFILKEQRDSISFEVYSEQFVTNFSWKFENVVVTRESKLRKLLKDSDFDLNGMLEIKPSKQERGKFDKVLAFIRSDKQSEHLAKILKSQIEQSSDYYELKLNQNFGIQLSDFLLLLESSFDRAIELGDKVLLFSMDKTIQDSHHTRALDKSNHIIAPTHRQMLNLLIADNPQLELSIWFGEYLNFRDISPYTTSGGIERENIFFGRLDILDKILNRKVSNYLIVGARQLGKSSLLKALKRRYDSDKRFVAHYLVMQNDNLIATLAGELKIERDIDSITNYITKSDKPMVFLIDEVDEFIETEQNNNYPLLQLFRKLSSENRAYFILAGYWQLYKSHFYEEHSPAKNLGGDYVSIGELEYDACKKLITEPMKTIGVSYENENIVEQIITQTGQRANLITIICDTILEKLDNKTITQENLDNALHSNKLANYTSIKYIKNKYERVVILATITLESFSFEELRAKIKKYNIKIESQKLEEILDKLVLSFVLQERDKRYSYQIPLFVQNVKKEYLNIESEIAQRVGEIKEDNKAKVEIAINLLDVLDVHTIAEKTGLSVEEVEALERGV